MRNVQGDVEAAGPSLAVQMLGLNGVPQAGDELTVYETEADARSAGAGCLSICCCQCCKQAWGGREGDWAVEARALCAACTGTPSPALQLPAPHLRPLVACSRGD